MHLDNCNILITRPENVAQNLLQQIQQLAGHGVCLPLFSIRSLVDAALQKKIVQKVAQQPWIIFISRNAAELTLPHLHNTQDLRYACVGPTTAAFVQSSVNAEVVYPQHPPYDSHALTQQFAKQQISLKRQRVLIFTGLNGDAWLAAALHDQGAIVETLAVYERIMPEFSPATVQQIFIRQKIDLILITCVTSLINLNALAAQYGLAVKDIPLLVVSERIRKHAIEMGHKIVYTSASMADSDIMSALQLACNNIKGG